MFYGFGMYDKGLKSSYILYLIWVLCFMFQDTNLIAQEYPFRRYRVSDGLSQSQGTKIYNDSRGYIWIGTNNGLSRFDGTDFINYSKKDGLPFNLIEDVFEDQARNIWVLASEGLSKYTGSGFIFYSPNSFLHEGNPFKKASPTKEAGKIFLTQGTNLVLFDNGMYTDLTAKSNSLDSIKIIDIYYDKPSGNLLIINSEGALLLFSEDRLKKISDGVFTGFKYNNNKLLLLAENKIYEYKNGMPVPFQMICKKGSKEVVQLKNVSGYRMKYSDGDELYEISLPFRPVDVYMDAQGTVWFPTENDIYRLQSTAFVTFGKNVKGDFWTLCKDRNDHLLLGTITGDLFEYDGLKFRKRNEYKALFPGYRNLVFYKGSRTLSNGEVWLSLSAGVLIWDGTAFRRLEAIPDNIQVCFIYEDPDNHKIMIGTNKGLFVIDHGKSSHYSRFTDDDLGIIEGVTKDRSGFYWLSGHKGIVQFDGSKITIVPDSVLPKRWTYNIETDSLGGIWVSSDDGIFCKKYSDSHFSAGLPSKFNRPSGTLKVLSKSSLLVGRGGDICMIDLDKYYKNRKDYFRIYDKSDGYSGDECLDNGIVKGEDGSFWILTSDNIIKFYPRRLKKNLLSPKINFTGICFETDSLTWQSECKDDFYFGTPSIIKFTRHHNKIKITYSGISTANPEKVRYISWLEGLDKSWSQPSDKREVIYENLLPGKYCFHLKGINADGIENGTSSDLAFIINPSFYETILFRIVSLLTLIFVTVFITRHYHLQKEERQKVSAELLKLQINSVIKEFDPHFTFNAISSLGALILTGKNKEAYLYLTKLSSMLRTVMLGESVVIKPLKEEMEFVKNYLDLQKLRFGDRFTYNISMSEDIDFGIEIPKMTIQTFVENSVKHGLEVQNKVGRIELSLNHQKSNTIITIKDNGVGREASSRTKSKGFGFGIKTVKRIFEIMNKGNRLKASVEIRDLTEYDQVAGTEVIIVIPDTFSFKKTGTLTDKLLK